MFRGEIFGYPLYLLKHFAMERKVRFCFADVMCKLWKFATQHEQEISHVTEPALSVMHAKGHALDCQVNFCILCILLG